MKKALAHYAHWLHGRWPAGLVERMPEISPGGSTNVPGVYIVGDLTGVPLLKFSAESGAKAVRTIAADRRFQEQRGKQQGVLDLAIIGAGVSGMSAALEAKQAGLDFRVYEAKRRFQTIADFPEAKPIFTYPTEMVPEGELQFRAEVKEALLQEMIDQTEAVDVTFAHVAGVSRSGGLLEVKLEGGETVRALRVIVGIGRSGNFRKLNVAGEDLEKVFNRLHDPKEFRGKQVLVVGGGDSALETSIALAKSGAEVTHSYRKPEFSRPKPENVEALEALPAGGDGSLRLELDTQVSRITPQSVSLKRKDGETVELPNDVVFSMIGREAPLDFFRRAGVRIAGDWNATRLLGLVAFVLLCLWVYHWKSPYFIPFGARMPAFLDPDPQHLTDWLLSAFNDPSHLLGTLKISASSRSFYYTLSYSLLIIIFGYRRIRRRRTEYVTAQTVSLTLIQVFPLFLLPELLLPWLGHNGLFDGGILGGLAEQLFPAVEYGHGREYWRAYGFILAWPLMVANWFTDQPNVAWLAIGFLQTFVLLPLLIYRFGKGVYCGWICSCGAMAETLGDTHRHKMPHGPGWNRLNIIGQGILAFAVLLLLLKLLAWTLGSGSFAAALHNDLAWRLPLINYSWLVDLMMAGTIGYGLYFWFSGRVWCRFACPLAALMHIYARFSRFRIIPEKKKCISCNVCTSVCHQGIDVMSFANKGLPMEDPECVRCSACVASCPTQVLQFGQVDRDGKVIKTDRLLGWREEVSHDVRAPRKT